jgi:phage gp29-like protein
MVERDKILFFEMGLPVAKGWLYERHGVPIPADQDELYTQDGSSKTLKEIQEQAEEARALGMKGLKNAAGGAEPEDGGDDTDPDGKQAPAGSQADGSGKMTARASHIILQARESAATNALVDNILEDLTGVSAQWLSPVRPIFRDLVMKAQDETVSDQDLIQALEAAISKMPEIFDTMDTKPLEKFLAESMEAAALNGAVEAITLRDKRKGRK